MKSPSRHTTGFVAILDALGAATYGPAEIDRFMDSRNIVLRLAQEKAEESLNVDLMRTFTFNDTIVFSLEAENDLPTIGEAAAFFLLLRKFMIDGLENGILFRGAIAIGSFYADSESNTVMGEAVTDAAAWYAQANWIGIHATPRATIILHGLLEGNKKNRDYVMVDYDVPLKNGSSTPLKVVNWPKALFVDGLVSPETRAAPRKAVLLWLGRQPIPNGSEDKSFRSITFFDAVVKKYDLTAKPVKAQAAK